MATPNTRCDRLILGVALCLGLAGCGGGRTQDVAGSPAGAPGLLAGRITIDGSATVLPVSKAMAAAFQKDNPNVQIAVESSGTGGGFKKFCAGQTDVSDASRPINSDESRQCKAAGIEFIELPVAFDPLSVVVNARNTFVDCLTVGELKTMWEPGAQGKVTRWNQVRSGFPDQPLALFGPSTANGTFDYFTLAVVGAESSSRTDYTNSADDTVLVNGVAADPNALGYFGYAYYLSNRDKLKAVSIDNGHGCVAPSAQAVADTTYQPLSRPLFLYMNKSSAARPEAKALARFYVAPENARYVKDIGYMPLPTATLLTVGRRLEEGVTGSMFGGRGSVVGITADMFQDEDRIKNALVQ